MFSDNDFKRIPCFFADCDVSAVSVDIMQGTHAEAFVDSFDSSVLYLLWVYAAGVSTTGEEF